MHIHHPICRVAYPQKTWKRLEYSQQWPLKGYAKYCTLSRQARFLIIMCSVEHATIWKSASVFEFEAQF
jgi:hypothetical protein